MNKRMGKISFILSLLAALAGGILPFVGIMGFSNIAIPLLIFCVLLFLSSIVIMIMMLVTNKSIIVKLSAIPVLYVIIIIILIVYRTEAHVFFINALGGNLVSSGVNVTKGTSVINLSIMLYIGIVFSSIPLVIAIVIRSRKLQQNPATAITEYEEIYAKIISMVNTGEIINSIPKYLVTLEIRNNGNNSYPVEKELLIQERDLRTFYTGAKIKVKVNPHNPKDMYISNDY